MAKGKNIARYRKLYEELRDQITGGMFLEGDLLPSENELCRQHNLTRPTVRLALSALVHEGYIKKRQGKGSIVNPLPKGIGILSVEGTTSALQQMNLSTGIIIPPEIRNWARPFMFPLPAEIRNSGCIYMERLRLVDGKPLFFDISHIPNINLPRFITRSFHNRSLFDILRKNYQIKVVGGEQKLSAIPADRRIAYYLEIPKGAPVLHLERQLETSRPGFVFFSSLYCSTSDYKLYGRF